MNSNNLKWIDSVQARDFENGAVRDHVRSIFKEHDSLLARVKELEVEVALTFNQLQRTKAQLHQRDTALVVAKEALEMLRDDVFSRIKPIEWQHRLDALLTAVKGEVGS